MCASCGWAALADEIDEMVTSGRYEWAENTLDGIRESVEAHEHASERQREAVQNIKAAALEEGS
jgi:Arc/MetJ-type ribon-helix-helix transcriptional regulator